MLKDFKNNLKVDQVVDPVVLSADANGSSVDLLEYDGVAFLFCVGESGDTLGASVYLELEIEDSADDSTFADAADADVVDTVTGNNTGTVAKIDAAAEDDVVVIGEYTGSERYVRPVLNITGTHTNGIPVGVVAVRYGAKELPVSN